MFDTIDDQLARDHDEVELETEEAGPSYQLVMRWAFLPRRSTVHQVTGSRRKPAFLFHARRFVRKPRLDAHFPATSATRVLHEDRRSPPPARAAQARPDAPRRQQHQDLP